MSCCIASSTTSRLKDQHNQGFVGASILRHQWWRRQLAARLLAKNQEPRLRSDVTTVKLREGARQRLPPLPPPFPP